MTWHCSHIPVMPLPRAAVILMTRVKLDGGAVALGDAKPEPGQKETVVPGSVAKAETG